MHFGLQGACQTVSIACCWHYVISISKGHLGISKGHLAISRGHLAISKGHLAISRDMVYRRLTVSIRVTWGATSLDFLVSARGPISGLIGFKSNS